jgi:hypothetical protein
MKTCPKCETCHNKNGIFCSRTCANSRGSRSESFKEKVRNKAIGKKWSEETRIKKSGENHHKRRGRNLPPVKNKEFKECMFCEAEIFTKGKFCSQECFSEYKKITNSAFVNYRLACKFKFNVYDYPNVFDLTLIEKFGWYQASNRGNNLTGISRDHKITVLYGFENNISPDIISHPANCQLMQHETNNKKKTKCSISLDDLYKDIENWNK